ncbi:uncharacterized protein N7477_004313 [Penicillium maclennaniae]|uniref:uncharacterized protein n=1 Tax=Penicillium maclennaniae TaxID=1343394 RepID=UPI00253F828B|nr:uncharacterized protein N7477_004313 [Penicillium maclennaniae]KAJ5674379.1 hypothetical protein N7477_004313 [Penicillium maclennaniae]
MANGDFDHWFQSFQPTVDIQDIQDALELFQDPETLYVNPASIQAAPVAQAVNEDLSPHRAQRATHASWTDQNSNPGLISDGYASRWQQLQQLQPIHQQQTRQQQQQTRQQQHQPSWVQNEPQGNQMQQPHWAQRQQQPPHHSGQQYTRQPDAKSSSSPYSSNTFRRAHNQPPKTSRLSSAIGAAAPAHQQDPKHNMVTNFQNDITGTSHSHPEQPQITSLPSDNSIMPATAQDYSSRPTINPPLSQLSRPRATPNMLNPSHASDAEQPAAFLSQSPLAAPQHRQNGRSGRYATEISNPRIPTAPDVWLSGLPPVESPADAQAPTAKRQRLQHVTKHAVNSSNGTSDSSKYAPRSHSRAHVNMRNDLVESIDAQDAAIKESYDPATIARDVLINADKHPTEPILNHHLELLSQKIPSINITSDLATLRWDLLDPEGPRDTPQGSPAPSRPHALGALPFARPSYFSRQTPPSPAPVPAPAPTSKFARPTFHPPQSPLPPSSPRPLLPTCTPRFTRPSVPTLNSTPIPTPAPTPVRQPVVELPSSSKQTPVPTSASSPAPLTNLASPSSSSRLRQASKPSQSPPKSSRMQMQVVVPTSPRGMRPRKKGQVGRPGKTAPVNHMLGVTINHKSTVPYPVFDCKWVNCEAELHNLQALQSHVLKVHIPHNLQCGWKECADRTPRAAANMWEHFTSQHLEKVAWASGDGPVISSGESHLAVIDLTAESPSGDP